MKRALIPGSFDPITLGHRDLIVRACALYDEVIVAVMNNRDKTYETTIAERAEMARLALADLARVRIVTDEGLLVDLFDKVRADVIVKGVRNEEDRHYEEQMAAWNLAHNTRAETVFLPALPQYENLSSHLVREYARAGQDLTALVSPAVAAYIAKHNLYRI